jgi:hypothetical protein
MINLQHDIAEIDVILKHLVKGTYEEVAFLIHKIQSQALPQHEANKAAETPAVEGEVVQGQ